jgi:hypothetical protein
MNTNLICVAHGKESSIAVRVLDYFLFTQFCALEIVMYYCPYAFLIPCLSSHIRPSLEDLTSTTVPQWVACEAGEKAKTPASLPYTRNADR